MPQPTYDTQFVKSTFVELEIPILDNLSAQIAGKVREI